MSETSNLRIRVITEGAVAANRELDKIDRNGRKAERATDSLRTSFLGLKSAVAGLGIGLLAKEVVETADKFQLMNARIKLVTSSAAEQEQVYQRLLGVSQETRSDLESSVDLYTRLARSTESLGLKQDDLIQLTTSVNQAFKVSGASTAEASAAITQLGQAFASGTLRGDEFNSVNEQAPRLMQAVADGLGVQRGALRQMAADGELTAERVSKALLKQSGAIEKEFAQMPVTVGDALQQLRNDLTDTFGRTDTGPVVDSIQDLREIITDPNFKESMATLTSAFFKLTGAMASGVAETVSFTKWLGEELAAAFNGVAADDIVRLEQKLYELQSHLDGDWFNTDIALTFTSDEEIQRQVEELKEKIKAAYELQGGVKVPVKVEDKKDDGEDDLIADKPAKLTAVQKRIQALEMEADLLGKAGVEAELYKLRMEGATDAELEAAEASLRRVEAYENLQERMEADKTSADAQRAEFESLVESLRTEEEALLESYNRRKLIILRNTEGNEEARKELINRLNQDFQKEAVGGFDKSIDTSGSLDEIEKSINAEFERRRELILANTQLTEEARLALEMELGRQRNEALAELDAERDAQVTQGWSNLLDVMSQYYQGMQGEEAAYMRAAIQMGKILLDEKKREDISKIWSSTHSAAMGAYDALASIPYVGPVLGAAAAGAVYVAGGAAAGKVAGLYDNGGFIPSGKYGIVGENGPELVSGPANVTSRQRTAEMAREAGGQAPAPQVTVQNIVSPSLVLEALNTPEGEDVVKNLMTRNRELL